MGVKGDVVTLTAQFGDARVELRDGCGDVGQFHHDRFGRLAQFSEVGEVVGNALVRLETLRKSRENPTGDRDVARDDVDAGD